MAYTPGLKRKELYLVKKTRRLPVPGEVVVKEGDIVSSETVVARAWITGQPVSVNVCAALEVEPEDVSSKYMIKKIGSFVKEKEIIAKRNGFFGIGSRVCRSMCDGTLEYISEMTGEAMIRKPPLPVEIRAHIPGNVVKTLPNEGVIIEVIASFVQGIFGVGGETSGNLRIIKSPDEIIEDKDITKEHLGAILVGGSLITRKALHKAMEIGVNGVVVGGIYDKDLTEFLGYPIGVAITGNEGKGLTLIITEGFGKISMSNKTFNLLKKFEGKPAYVNGATQIRAGVIRPEIIIPRDDIDEKLLSKLAEEAESSREGMRPGTHIRIIRDPYFGALGYVTSLPIELRKMGSESDVRVLEAELEDGIRVVVPRANVEIIEE